ncbi:AtpZ/AtpI family protein [Algoriphagus sp. H41]|uniref:AtpZ/AtpI family protein n=1 Tax=Algoriphagus oliviformis TaxID=2811231 RepID=A0ABS3BZY1_9BACT|nr:AtpZ/AtpI family protein [Algoriphagus oliviformis]MBN7809446.1 AtpZ/AtpI family protein [Algoriphagus oliviformis]
MEPEKSPDKKPQNGGPPTWAKYMGLSFQLFGIIGGGTWLGWWVQQKSAMKFPLWILVGCFASIALAFYQLLKSMQRDK